MDYTLKLNKSGMDVIVAALTELPYKVAKPVLDEALRQFVSQEAAANEPVAEPVSAANTRPENTSPDPA